MAKEQVKAVSLRSQAKFITVDTLEYMVALICGGAFLAHLTQTVGIPDSIGGIISAFVSLAGISQLITMMIVRPGKRKKGFTTSLVIINQFLWALLYLIPLPFPISSGTRIALFVIIKLVANLLLKMCYPTKFVWQMVYVEEHKISVYNATKEMVSLICGMIFSLLISILSDKLEAAGRMDDSFILCAVFIAVISTLEGALLISTKEPEPAESEAAHRGLLEPFKATFGNKNFRRIIYVIAIYNFFLLLSTSFYGVYQTGALGFSLTYSQIITFVGMSVWAALARFAGRLAQRISWARVVLIFMLIHSLSFALNIFTVPGNGKVLFFIYSIFHYIANAGVKLPLLAFEYVDPDNRTGAVAITQAIGGVCGFIGALAGGAIVDAMGNGSELFGRIIYPQQILSAISAVGIISALVLLSRVSAAAKKL